MIYCDSSAIVFFTKNNKTVNKLRHENKTSYNQETHKEGR